MFCAWSQQNCRPRDLLMKAPPRNIPNSEQNSGFCRAHLKRHSDRKSSVSRKQRGLRHSALKSLKSWHFHPVYLKHHLDHRFHAPPYPYRSGSETGCCQLETSVRVSPQGIFQNLDCRLVPRKHDSDRKFLVCPLNLMRQHRSNPPLRSQVPSTNLQV